MRTDFLDQAEHLIHQLRQAAQLWDASDVAERGQGQNVEGVEDVADNVPNKVAVNDSRSLDVRSSNRRLDVYIGSRCGESALHGAGQGEKSEQGGLHLDYLDGLSKDY